MKTTAGLFLAAALCNLPIVHAEGDLSGGQGWRQSRYRAEVSWGNRDVEGDRHLFRGQSAGPIALAGLSSPSSAAEKVSVPWRYV
jgi:hypothetical protein